MTLALVTLFLMTLALVTMDLMTLATLFLANAGFQHALQAKKRAVASSAVTDTLAKQREKCPRCQREVSRARFPLQAQDRVRLGPCVRQTPCAIGRAGGQDRRGAVLRVG